MTLDEAIKERQKVIEVQEKLYEESSSDESKGIIKSAIDNDRQFVKWLRELREAKQLLKAAIKDIGDMSRYCLGMCCDSCPQIHTLSRGHQSCIWQHEEAALKLIGETNDEP